MNYVFYFYDFSFGMKSEVSKYQRIQLRLPLILCCMDTKTTVTFDVDLRQLPSRFRIDSRQRERL